MSLYDSIDTASYDLLEVFRLGAFFDNHNIPPVVFPILLAALTIFLAFYFLQPGSAPAATNPPPETGNSTPGTDNCGDGICEPSELHSGACPQDCGQQSGNESMAGTCGDGTCDEAERQTGMCPQDCGGSTPDAGNLPEGTCGDGTCEDLELRLGVCPDDCA